MTLERFPKILIPSLLQITDRESDLLDQIFSQTVRPVAAHYRPPRGHSESQFEHELWRYFPGKIHAGLVMQRTDSASPYAPDFAYIDPKLNLHIDIEVDEPYTYDTRQPLHYLGCVKDEQRNQYFLNWNWVVIRFSEAQVVKSAASCCKTIASVIATLTGESSVMLPFRQVPSLKPERCWTLEEAVNMATVGKRESYLTQRPSVNLSQRNRKKPPKPKRASVVTANFTFFCPECGDGPIRWQGHYICCPNCSYDAFAL